MIGIYHGGSVTLSWPIDLCDMIVIQSFQMETFWKPQRHSVEQGVEQGHDQGGRGRGYWTGNRGCSM